MRAFKLLLLFFISIQCANAQWYPVSTFDPIGRYHATSFVIGSKAIVGIGQRITGTKLYDMWSYDSNLQSWTQIMNYPGFGSYAATSFSINGKGYVCLGADSYDVGQNDLWEYDPIANSWT